MEAAQPPESFRDGLIAAAELRLCEHSICMENLGYYISTLHDDSDGSGIRNQVFGYLNMQII